MQQDRELLNRYVQERDQEAFGDLVRRHGDWVYSSARRQLGDAHLAEDVTQAVFLLLAKKAAGLQEHAHVQGWLFKATSWCVKEARRQRASQARREMEVAAMRREESETADWEMIAPELDEAVGRLGKGDREAVLLRFYRGMSLAEVGQGLGVSEEAAKKRVQRAVERLRGMLANRGVVAGVAALSVVMAERVVEAAPVGVVESVVAGTGAGAGSAGAGGIVKGAMNAMMWVKVKVAAVALMAVTAGVGGIAAVETKSGSATVATTSVALAPGEPQAAVKGTLKSGISVELLGVAEASSGAKAGWRPDGAPWPDRTYVRGKPSADSATRVLEFPIRITGPAGRMPDLVDYHEIDWCTLDAVDRGGKPIAGVRTRIAYVPTQTTADTLRVQIWDEPWHDEKVIGLAELIPPGDGAVSCEVASRGTVRIDQLADVAGPPSIRLDEPMHGSEAVAIRLVAVDGDGRVYRAVSGIEKGIADGRLVSTLRFGVPSEKVKQFVLQSRRYAGWVEFQNVSLKPGTKTDVRVNTSDEAGAGPVTSERRVRAGDRLAVTIWDLAGPNEPSTWRARVAESGKVRLPLVGRIAVAGLSAEEVGKAVNRAYHDQNLIRDAVVEVRFIEDAQEPAVISGLLQVNDRLLVRIWDVESPNKESVMMLQVLGEGQVIPPKLGSVKVVGLSEEDAADAIAEAYRKEGVIMQAILSVERLPAVPTAPTQASVMGMVRRPGQYGFGVGDRVTLKSLLASAGIDQADVREENLQLAVIRRSGAGEQVTRQVTRLPAKPLYDSGAGDMTVLDGDIVQVTAGEGGTRAGMYGWIEVRDMASEVAFYQELLGLKVVRPADGVDVEKAERVVMEAGDSRLVLHANPAGKGGGGSPGISLNVKDIESVRTRLEEQGVPMAKVRTFADVYPKQKVCDGVDPEGNKFELIQYLEGPATTRAAY